MALCWFRFVTHLFCATMVYPTTQNRSRIHLDKLTSLYLQYGETTTLEQFRATDPNEQMFDQCCVANDATTGGNGDGGGDDDSSPDAYLAELLKDLCVVRSFLVHMSPLPSP